MKRLLLMSCSGTKKTNDGLMPAIERYDGPSYRVLRSYLNGHRRPTIRILSAAYGLIEPTHPIRFYDYPMTEEQADLIKSDFRTINTFQQLVLRADDVFVYAGGLYMALFEAWRPLLQSRLPSDAPPILAPWTVCAGAPGQRLQQLKRWLYASAPQAPRLPSREDS